MSLSKGTSVERNTPQGRTHGKTVGKLRPWLRSMR